MAAPRAKRVGRVRGIGYDYVHTVIDDHSRVANAEIHDDEKGATAPGVLERAIAFYATLGVNVERVISDNAFAYRRSAALREVTVAHGIKQNFIKPNCPWTNGKVERPNRTRAAEWAYARLWTSNTDRAAGLSTWLDDKSGQSPPRHLRQDFHRSIQQRSRSVHLAQRLDGPSP
ncbi:DDE-type integrase/transposase/recombinase [Microbacterium sp. Au-Mic1]|uniref:DDE-type integrase/transposase/recombinase n=1 Tax=Microbacterium sp. Au-Mic1 TaxID=2906457 RepID=UPI0035A8340B